MTNKQWNKYQKEWVRKHPEKKKEYNRKSKARERFWFTLILNLFKSTEPCVDCGKVYPWQCMEFDHCRGIKSRGVASLDSAGALLQQAEAEKCDLVCANCHRLRTYERQQQYRAS